MKRIATCMGLAGALLAAAATIAETPTNSAPVKGPILLAAKTGDAGTTAVEEKESLEIGDAAPAWSELEGTDGKKHSLKDLKDVDVVAVVFTCNHCPVAVAYEDRLSEIANDYKDKSVALVAINVNNVEADKLPAMKERAKEKDFEFAYLYDPSQKIGRSFGATVTPHAFVIDKNRRVVYMGAIDDNMDASAVNAHYLRDAVDAALAGKVPEVTTSKQFGCGIQYE